MAISLTKEQMLERLMQRKDQFSDAVGKRIKPELPFTVASYDELGDKCSQVVMAFLDVVFAEDT